MQMNQISVLLYHRNATMNNRKSKKTSIAIPLCIIMILLTGGYGFYHFDNEAKIYEKSMPEAYAFFREHSAQPFVNSALDAEPYQPEYKRDDALFFYETPEGFTMISHSPVWNHEMLENLYYELLMNEHGDEINALYEVIVYPFREEEGTAAAMYSPGTTAVSFFIQFPAFPEGFSIEFPQDIGSITLFNGDNNITVESMASSLSHEYGHHYTFFYMFGFGQNARDSDVNDSGDEDSLAQTVYARLREAGNYNLITTVSQGETYFQDWHRYLIEVAAEDYVQLMGSPTTRQVVDFIDVQQTLRGSQQPENVGRARNAFPQGNMMIPLANDVQGLKDYFYSFIDLSPREPIEEKKDITIQIQRNSVEHNLITGLRTFVYYTISWNAPYQNAIYTLACYDPGDYSGWGIPIRTVRLGQNTSSTIGEYAIERGNQIFSLDDGLTEGVKVFYVIAQLPDGTYYISEKLEYNF